MRHGLPPCAEQKGVTSDVQADAIMRRVAHERGVVTITRVRTGHRGEARWTRNDNDEQAPALLKTRFTADLA